MKVQTLAALSKFGVAASVASTDEDDGLAELKPTGGWMLLIPGKGDGADDSRFCL